MPADLDAADAIVCTSSLRLVATVIAIGSKACESDDGAIALQNMVAEAVIADVGIDPRLLSASSLPSQHTS